MIAPLFRLWRMKSRAGMVNAALTIVGLGSSRICPIGFGRQDIEDILGSGFSGQASCGKDTRHHIRSATNGLAETGSD